MTAPQETIVNDSPLTESTALPLEIESTRPTLGAEFLDDSWAEEFDRRLAAWQSEPPPVAAIAESVQ
jgi:hypothetical protein